MFQCILYYLPVVESLAVIVGVIFVAVQIRKQTKASHADHDRQKKQSTIEFYNSISTESQSFLDKIGGRKLDLLSVNTDKMLRKSVVRYLSRLERLAIGIATDVYDFNVLNLMSGRYICKKFNQLKKYIDESPSSDSKKQKFYWTIEITFFHIAKVEMSNSASSRVFSPVFSFHHFK